MNFDLKLFVMHFANTRLILFIKPNDNVKKDSTYLQKKKFMKPVSIQIMEGVYQLQKDSIIH